MRQITESSLPELHLETDWMKTGPPLFARMKPVEEVAVSAFLSGVLPSKLIMLRI